MKIGPVLQAKEKTIARVSREIYRICKKEWRKKYHNQSQFW